MFEIDINICRPFNKSSLNKEQSYVKYVNFNLIQELICLIDELLGCIENLIMRLSAKFKFEIDISFDEIERN